MRDHIPSPSALNVAAQRALHQTSETPPVFVDPMAFRILGTSGAAVVEAHRASADETRRLRATLAVRAVVAEEVIAEAAPRGVRQCVILGAGLDTFAYRNTDPALRVFEVDHPATQAWKRDLLRAAAIDMPSSLRWVAANFERDDLFAALTAAGLDLARPVVFVMLGVVVYLARGTILGTLRRIAEGCADNSEIVLDYTEPFHDAEPRIRSAYEAAAARVAAGGEPWITLFEPDDLHATLRGLGFAHIRDLGAAVLNERFCAGRSDGFAVAPLVHLLSARK